MGPRPRFPMGTGAAGLCSVHKDTAGRLSSASAVGKIKASWSVGLDFGFAMRV